VDKNTETQEYLIITVSHFDCQHILFYFCYNSSLCQLFVSIMALGS